METRSEGSDSGSGPSDTVVPVSETAREALRRERALIADLQALLATAGGDRSSLATLKDALAGLDGLFLLVLVGEFNAGKSSLVNALLGAEVMPEGVTPTTDRVTLVTHGAEARREERSTELSHVSHPAARLQDLALVDTPGTNAVIARHQELTERFVPRADLVLFVTSADRPYTQSERAFLELIQGWGKPVAIVVNKADLLESEAERAQVVEYVRTNARETLGHAPPIFTVAARAAKRARLQGDDDALLRSGLPELERHLEETLDTEKLRLKLGNPLGVARHVADDLERSLEGQRDLLTEDRHTLEEVERQQRQWRKDVRREGQSYLDRVKTVLLEVERRGEVFFDEMVRMSRITTLLRTEKVRVAFEEQVLKDAERRIDEAVGALVDWLLERTVQQWEDVIGFVNERRAAGAERVIGEVGGRFQYDRQALIRALGERADGVLAGFDRRNESRRLAEALQASVVQTGLMQVGGLGLGAATVALVSSAAWDITGIAAGVSVMALSLLVLPRRRAQAKRQLHRQMQALRDGLEEGLGRQLEDEADRAAERLGRAVEPYTRFVRTELDRLEALQGELDTWRAEHAEVRALVDRV
jgi:small GTP-binding protein